MPAYNDHGAVRTAKELKDFKAIADYVGTSVAMIEANYSARQGFNLDRTVFEQQPSKYVENLVAGPGFEPGTSRL